MSTGRFTDVLKTAAMQARLCRAAYEGRAAVDGLAGQVNARFRYFNAAYVTGAVLGFRDHCHVVSIGTNDRYDWMQNLEADIDDRDGFAMHRGFRRAAELFYAELMRSGASQIWAGKKLFIGGHSAGGAIAAAISSEIIAPQVCPDEVYTFGAPRVFSPQLAAKYATNNLPTYRFVMPGDPVPRLPLRKFRHLFGGASYSHAGIEMRLHDDGEIEVEPPTCLAERFYKAFGLVGIYSLLKLTPWRLVPTLIERHHIARYQVALNEAIAKVDQ
jgi:hypothetical protein